MAAKYLKTSHIAKTVGLHLEQMRLARIALRCEFIAGNIRAMATDIVKASAAGHFQDALELAFRYKEHIRSERKKAEEAVGLLKSLPCPEETTSLPVLLKRKEAAEAIGVSMDVLRNWERNGLIDIPRSANGYRHYREADIRRMKIIYTLRSANHSMMAVLRMLTAMDRGRDVDVNTLRLVKTDEDICHATDRWLAVLIETERDTEELIGQLQKMIQMF